MSDEDEDVVVSEGSTVREPDTYPAAVDTYPGMPDDIVQIAERLLGLGLVPRRIRVGDVEVEVAGYSPPRTEGDPQNTGRQPRNFYELDEMTRGRR